MRVAFKEKLFCTLIQSLLTLKAFDTLFRICKALSVIFLNASPGPKGLILPVLLLLFGVRTIKLDRLTIEPFVSFLLLFFLNEKHAFI